MYRKSIVIVFILVGSLGASNAMKSALVPGLGEKSLGNDSRAKLFMSSEIVIWGSYLLGKTFNRMYIDNYSGFAELHAGASMDSKGYGFVVDMSNYNSMLEFNEDMMRQHNEDAFESVYSDEGDHWQWDSTENRYKFNEMRESSIIAQKFAEFSVAGLLINRIVSVVDVLYLEKMKKELDVGVIVIPEGNDAVSLNVSFSLK